MANINELYARWRILEICNEATVLAKAIKEHEIAALTGAAALKTAEALDAPHTLVERMQRDLVTPAAEQSAGRDDVSKPTRTAAPGDGDSARRLN